MSLRATANPIRSFRHLARITRSYATNTPSGPSATGGTATSSPAASGGPQAPAQYCASLVQRLDPDAWLTSYFWPRREKEWFLAWRAFNLELHLITTLSQPALAAIRFQFWRDALKAIFTARDGEAIPQHPVVLALADMKRHRPVQRYYLSQMIDVRAKSLNLPPASPSLASHLSTHGPLSTSLLLGPLPLLLPPSHSATSSTAHVLSHLASLLTVTSLIRNLPILVKSKNQLNIPADVCERHSIVEEQVLRQGADAKGLRDAVYEIGTRGMDEMITARREVKGMICDEGAEGAVQEGQVKNTSGKIEPKSVRPLFLSAIPAEAYLKRLEAADFDPFHPALEKPDWKLAPTIWWRNLSGRL